MRKENALPYVSIIIPNYNARNDLRKCLQSVRNLNYHEKEVIVVDNDSSDDSAEMVSEEFPEVKLIKTERMGIGQANNIGIKNAKGDFIVFDLNSDDIVARDWLTQLVKSMSSRPGVGIVCGKRLLGKQNSIIDSAGAKIHFLTGTVPAIGRGKKDSQKYDAIREVDYVPVPMVRKEVFQKIGLCDTEYYLYYEETDFCLRAKKAGFEILYVPTAVFWHQRSATVGKSNPRKHYYERRNRIRFIMKNFPSSMLVIPFVFHAVFMSLFYSLYYSFRTNSQFLEAEKNAVFWNFRNAKSTVEKRYAAGPPLK